MKEYPAWSPTGEPDWEQISQALSPLGVGIVSYRGSPIPLVIFPLPQKNIYPIDAHTVSTVVFDLVNVSPHPLPVFYAMVVVFNDFEDPLWTIRTIPVTKFYLDSDEPGYQQSWDVVSKIDLNIPLRFCNEHQICGLVMVDDDGRIVFNDTASVQTPHVMFSENEERIREIEEVLRFLNNHPAKQKVTQFGGVSAKLHSNLCTFLSNPTGLGISVPRSRNLIKSRSYLLSRCG